MSIRVSIAVNYYLGKLGHAGENFLVNQQDRNFQQQVPKPRPKSMEKRRPETKLNFKLVLQQDFCFFKSQVYLVLRLTKAEPEEESKNNIGLGKILFSFYMFLSI